MEKIIDKVIKIILYLLVFLLPIFFLPVASLPILSNKKLLLVLSCFLVCILWLIKIMKTGKLNLVWNKISFAVFVLLIVLEISTVFSITRAQSFWGTSVEPDTFFNFLLYGLVFFLFSNLISKKEVFQIIKILLLSSSILALLFLVQEIFGSIFPWNFAKLKGFNTVGSAYGLAVFFGGVFIIWLGLIINNMLQAYKIEKILGWVVGPLLFINILLINFWAAWVGIFLATAAIIWVKLKSANLKKIVWTIDYFLPVIILAIALIFIFVKLPINKILNLPLEVNLSYGASFNIARKSLGEGFKNVLFGSGPATFVYKYDLYHSSRINLTDFWQIKFNQSLSALITFLATSGILGVLAIFYLMFLFFYEGIVKSKKDQVIIFAGGAYFLVLWFIYPINFCLMFFAFLMIGLWLSLLGKSRKISLANPPYRAFFSMLGAIILIVLLIGGAYIYSQKYIADIEFAKGLQFLNVQKLDLNKALASISSAANRAKANDNYFRTLSQALLLKINEVLGNQNLSKDEKQAELANIISAIQKTIQNAIKINPKNSQNWFKAGYVYENLISVDTGFSQQAIIAYRKAIEFDPINPQIPFNLGRVYGTIAQRVKEEAGRKQAIELAIDNFDKSIKLKSNFTPAYYLLAQIYEMKGDKNLAIKNYQAILQLEPSNAEAIERLKKLTK